MTNEDIIAEFRKTMPPVFAATEVDKLTGNAVRWTTLQNRRGKHGKTDQVPPPKCFRYDGSRKILIVRDEFLDWWLDTLATVV